MIRSIKHKGLQRFYEDDDARGIGGNLRGFWSMKVCGNWRIIFRFEDGDAVDVDLVDYH